MSLTERQAKILEFITGQIKRRGLPPSIREIAERFSVSIGAIQDHLGALEKKGAIERMKDQARGIIVKSLKGGSGRLPILGRVPAGVPLEAIEEVEDYLSVDEFITKRANFVLRVKGDSMEPEIHEGDLVLVQTTPTAESGEVVVARMEDGEATVKRLRRQRGLAFLEPANERYKPIFSPFTLIGKVTSLIRVFNP